MHRGCRTCPENPSQSQLGKADALQPAEMFLSHAGLQARPRHGHTAAHPLHTYRTTLNTPRAGQERVHSSAWTLPPAQGVKPNHQRAWRLLLLKKHTNAEVKTPQTSHPWRKRPRTQERKGKTHMQSRGSFTAFKSLSGNKLTLV